MYHSITFTDKNGNKKNTWDDWHLIPMSRPLFNPPRLKERYFSIPGSSDVLDMCETFKGYPTYENREGTLSFMVDNGHEAWHEIFHDIRSFLHGKKMRAELEDDKSHYYEGRFLLNDWDPGKHWSKIEIEYKINPYKMNNESSIDDWKWDPFNFNTGVIQCDIFNQLRVSGDRTVDLGGNNYIGRKPVCPEFEVASIDGFGVDVVFVNYELGIDIEFHLGDGITTNSRVKFTNINGNNSSHIRFIGNATVSIIFRSGGF